MRRKLKLGPGPSSSSGGSARWMGLTAVMLCALVGLLIAFASSLSAVSRQFEHALIAERQAAAVEDIARDGKVYGPLSQNLAAYRALIAQEGQFLPGDQHRAQLDEVAEAGRLATMADSPIGRPGVIILARDIAQKEQAEVQHERAELHALRLHMWILALALTLVAVAASVTGAIQLHRANRALAIEVAARTAELHSVDRSRRLFFAKASHELRTPVTAIRAIAEVALAGTGADIGTGTGAGKGASATVPLQDIVAQTSFLAHRIDEMLALASAEEGRPSLAPALCDLVDILDAAVIQARPYARSMEVEIVQNLPDRPIPVLADRHWLVCAVLAVMDNGIKFSNPGEALDLCLIREGDTDIATGIITITDTGPGVLPRELPRIFDAYYQAEEGRSRGGTGLGLALARWVAEQHGGRIHAENQPEGGCRVVITLPLAKG